MEWLEEQFDTMTKENKQVEQKIPKDFLDVFINEDGILSRSCVDESITSISDFFLKKSIVSHPYDYNFISRRRRAHQRHLSCQSLIIREKTTYLWVNQNQTFRLSTIEVSKSKLIQRCNSKNRVKFRTEIGINSFGFIYLGFGFGLLESIEESLMKLISNMTFCLTSA